MNEYTPRDQRMGPEYWRVMFEYDGKNAVELAEQQIAVAKSGLPASAEEPFGTGYRLIANRALSWRGRALYGLAAGYSAGYPVSVLARLRNEVVDGAVAAGTFPQAVGWNFRTFTESKVEYRAMLEAASWGVLLGADETAMQKLRSTLTQLDPDPVLHFIAGIERDPSALEGPVLHQRHYKKLLGVIQAKPEQRATRMQSYLRTWYEGAQGIPGYRGLADASLETRSYWGSWAVEVAAVVKILGMDDTSFRDNEYYPADLLHSES